MTHEYELIISIKELGETAVISGELTNQDSSLFEEYLQYADELIVTNLVQSGFSSEFHLELAAGSQLSISSTLPPWDDVIVFLHKYRPVGLQSEPTYFYAICNRLSKCINHPYFRQCLETPRNYYGCRAMETLFQLRVGETLVNSERTLNDYLNAYEYHRDKGKKAIIDEIQKVLPSEAARSIFLMLLSSKAKGIITLAEIVRLVLGKRKQIILSVPPLK